MSDPNLREDMEALIEAVARELATCQYPSEALRFAELTYVLSNLQRAYECLKRA